jgi:uncharacterized protein (TIGR03435 family)
MRVVIATFGCLLLRTAFAQAVETKLEFEAASVRPGTPVSRADPASRHGGPGTLDPGQISYRGFPIKNLILEAYDVPGYRLSLPESFKNKNYDIVAKIPEGTSKEQFDTMLLNLLVDRLGLRSHRQPKEFNAYTLVVGSRGPMLKKTTFAPVSDQPRVATRIDPDGVRLFAGVFLSQPIDGRLVMSAGKVTMGNLVRFLEEGYLRSPVTDATNLTGEYDIKLQFSPEGLALPDATLRALSSANAPDSASNPAPNLFEALEQQLGLKLERTKATVDMIVVDGLEEQPTEN